MVATRLTKALYVGFSLNFVHTVVIAVEWIYIRLVTPSVFLFVFLVAFLLYGMFT